MIRKQEVIQCLSKEKSPCDGEMVYISWGGRLLAYCTRHYDKFTKEGEKEG